MPHAQHLGDHKQDWATPQSFFDKVNKEFGFTLDACADLHNHKCTKYYCKADNGLVKPWGPSEVVWCNPPYGAITPWLEKGYGACKTQESTVVYLLPASTGTKWFADYCTRGEIRFIRGRVQFVNIGPGGIIDSGNSSNFDNVVVIFDPATIDSDNRKVVFYDSKGEKIKLGMQPIQGRLF